MIFIETPTFTKQVTQLITDDQLVQLQKELIENSKKGSPIRGGKGLRKIRVALTGRGKSGGARVIYYRIDENRIYFLLIYTKAKKEALNKSQVKDITKLMEE